jgi:selenocysteine-specific elongation factor
MGYVVLLGLNRLHPGESAFAQIRLDEPTLALPGDRFIVRQYSPMVTIGGGEILDAMPVKHRRTDKTVVDKLRVFKEGSSADRIMAIVDEAGLRTLELSALAVRRGLAPDRVREQMSALEKTGRLRILVDNPFTVVSAKAFNDAADATAAAIRRFHESNPLVQGIGREELKARLFGGASNLLFQSVIEKLVADKKIELAHEVIHEPERKVALTSEEVRMRDQLAERFRSMGLQAPSADEVINSLKLDRVTARKIIQLMLKDNLLVKISEELIMDREALDKLITDVKALKAKNPKLGVGEFKNLTGVSRKFAIPLLEYLDRQRVTRRAGDERTIL